MPRSGSSSDLSTAAALRLSCDLSPWNGEPGLCQWCADPLPPKTRRSALCSESCRRAFERNHIWRIARTAARRRGKYTCSVPGCDRTRHDGIEVNHIDPLVGAGYGPSCQHHQDNLELLCVQHHRDVTAQQRRDRANQKP